MNISIDIDGVLTELEKYKIDKGSEYCEKIGTSKFIKYSYNVGTMFGWSEEQENGFWKEYLLDYYTNTLPAKYAVEILHKLKSEGHKLIINTSRCSFNKGKGEFVERLRHETKMWFLKHDIPYDKFVFSYGDKLSVIEKYNADCHIEDYPAETALIAKYVPVILCNAKHNEDYNDKNIYRAKSWKEVYSVIKTLEKDR